MKNNNNNSALYFLIVGAGLAMILFMLFTIEYLPSFTRDVLAYITFVVNGVSLGMSLRRDRINDMRRERELNQLAHEVDTKWEDEYEDIDVPTYLRDEK